MGRNILFAVISWALLMCLEFLLFMLFPTPLWIWLPFVFGMGVAFTLTFHTAQPVEN